MKRDTLHILKSLTVLIAEDDAVMLEQNAQTLKIFFKEVFKAKDGLEAFNIYEEQKPSIILADINMPIMDGLNLTKKIRAIDYETPIVLITAYTDGKILLKAANLGIDGYLIKPLQLEDLLLTCRKSLARKKIDNSVITFVNNTIYNNATKELYKDGVQIDLGHKEQILLNIFLNALGRTVTKKEIVEALWPLEEVTDSAFKNLLGRLREKIGKECIISVKGAGWRFVVGS